MYPTLLVQKHLGLHPIPLSWLSAQVNRLLNKEKDSKENLVLAFKSIVSPNDVIKQRMPK